MTYHISLLLPLNYDTFTHDHRLRLLVGCLTGPVQSVPPPPHPTPPHPTPPGKHDDGLLAGSPLGIFLTLRKVNPAKGRCLGGREAARLMLGDDSHNADGLPAVERLYNLYHPFDPVGFRLVLCTSDSRGRTVPRGEETILRT